MTLQNWYYTLAIVNNVLWMVFVLILLGLVIKLYQTVRSAPERMQQTLKELFHQNKKEVLTMAGMAAFTILGTALRRWFSRN